MLKKRFLADLGKASNAPAPAKCDSHSAHTPPPTLAPSSQPVHTHTQIKPVHAPPPPGSTQHRQPSVGIGSMPSKSSQKQTHTHVASKTRWMPGSALCSKASDQPKFEDDCDDLSPKPVTNEHGERLYCLCRKPYNPQAFMIGCDQCDDWFHGRCVKIAASAAKVLDKYICPRCTARNKRKLESGHKDSEQPAQPKRPRPNPVTREVSPDARSDGSEGHLNVPSSSERRDSESSSSSPVEGSPHSNNAKHHHHQPPPQLDLSLPTTPKTHNTPPEPNTPTSTTQTPTTTNPSSSLPRCASTGCLKHAQERSTFCGDTCAAKSALVSLQNRQKMLMSPGAFAKSPVSQMLQQFSSPCDNLQTSCGRPTRALTLEEIQSQQASVSAALCLVDQKLKLLNTAIERVSQNSFDKPLCGCPLDDSLQEIDRFCPLAVAECSKHAHWQSLKKSDLVHERISHDKTLNRLKVDEEVLRAELGC